MASVARGSAVAACGDAEGSDVPGCTCRPWKPWDTDDLLTRGLHAYTLHQADISGGQGRWFWSVLQLGSLVVLHSVLSKLKLSVIGWFSFQA